MKKNFLKLISFILFTFLIPAAHGQQTVGAEANPPIQMLIKAFNDRCLDVHRPDYDAKLNGAKVQLWKCLAGETQRWFFEDGQIKSQNGLCLDVDNNSPTNGTKVQLWTCNNSPNQRWSYEDKQLKAQNGLCLDLDYGRSNNGTKIQAWSCTGLDNQKWLFASTDLPEHLIPRYKPTYHFAKQIGSMPFDPNGALYFNGKYHLMYIFQNEGGNQYGHVTSTDLFHWEDQPTALTDGKNFSGNAFLDKSGKPIIIYHMVGHGNSIAVSKDNNMTAWEKPSKYIPLKTTPSSGPFKSWDPHGWLENSSYYSIFGGAQPALFKSSDLEHWVYQGPFIDKKWRDGLDMSCPKFFPLGDRHVFMFISHNTGSQFVVGKWQNEKFIPETHRTMNWPGGSFFAPETLLDNQGRRIMWAWVLEPRGDLNGKMGVMSLPRVFTIDTDHVVHINPPSEIETLRSAHQTENNVTLAAHETQTLNSIHGNTLEIKLDLNLLHAEKAGIKVLQSPDGQEETTISYDTKSQTLNLDVSKSSFDRTVHYGWGDKKFIGDQYDDPKTPERFVQSASLKLPSSGVLSLRIFVDKSIVEVFANGTEVMTARVYPTLNNATQVSLFADGGVVDVSKIESWDMAL